MRIALCQFSSTKDKAQNLESMRTHVWRAVEHGADLVVFPEYAMWADDTLTTESGSEAEDLDGAFVTAMSELATEAEVSVVFGMFERVDSSEKVFNTLVALNRSGEVVQLYRKQHLYDAFGVRESDFIVAGDLEPPATFAVRGVSIGLLTCYDLRFPEAARLHADAETDLLLYPAAWVPGPLKEDHWQTLLRARAIENTMFVAGVGQTFNRGVGASMLVSPTGTIAGALGSDPGVRVCDVDTEEISRTRAKNPSLANRRYRVTPRT